MIERRKDYNIELSGVICLLSIIGFSLLTLFVKINSTKKFDKHVGTFIRGFKSKELKYFFKGVSGIFSPLHVLVTAIVISILIISVLWSKKLLENNNILKDAILFLSVNLLGYLSNIILKPIFKRPRPNVKPLSNLAKTVSYSYPSTHAMMAFTFFIAAAYILYRYISSKLINIVLWIICIITPLIVGFSRAYLNKHYVTDVIGGFLFSCIIITGITLIMNRALSKK